LHSQVYREVFEYLINDFKTYQNLLAAIKQEYELVLRDQEYKLKELDPLRVGSKYPALNKSESRDSSAQPLIGLFLSGRRTAIKTQAVVLLVGR